MIRKIAVVGIGRIGKSIALTFASAGYSVLLVTRRGPEGYKDFKSYVEQETAKGRISVADASKIDSMVNWTSKFDDVSHSDLVLETIIEDQAEKVKALTKIESACTNQAIIASNTSSLSINELAMGLKKPDRFIGLHFFNPAQVMKLVEVIPGDKTAKATVDDCRGLVSSLNKVPITAPDTPGFIVNRILFPMINQAIYCVEEHLSEPEEIDKCLKLGANLPMGPLALADFIGLDTCLIILETLHNRTGNPVYKPPQLLKDMVKKGVLGRKTGQGFHKY